MYFYAQDEETELIEVECSMTWRQKMDFRAFIKGSQEPANSCEGN